jgi:stage III sporulation protein AF
MSIITEWITNIIILVLLASVIELLLPGNQFQNYIKMVIGLLILMAMLSPVLKLVKTDLDEVFNSMDLPAAAKESEIKKSIEKNKSEIQDTQHAYILEQMAVQMKKQVQEELKKTYELGIVDLQIQMDTNAVSLNPEQITGVKVVLAQDRGEKNVSEVKEVDVSVSEQGFDDQAENDAVPDDVIHFLAGQWQLDSQHVEAKMEGGEESSQ